MSHLITVATCSLNQWSLDLPSNRDRIIRSISIAKSRGATLRVGPELEVTGYGCLDHFLELDLYEQCWEVLVDVMAAEEAQGVVCDVGMPVVHRGVYYNCRVIFKDKKILLIRPKMALANDGNFREMRYFTAWTKERVTEEHLLPKHVRDFTGQKHVFFGDAVIETLDTVFAAESCEELFTPAAPHIAMALDGVEIFTNSSGSHHQLRKLNQRMDLILEATRKSGGVYLYANQQGCDGDRLYYDGCAMIVINGEIVAQGSQFSLNDVEVVTATVDLADVRSYRYAPSRRQQAVKAPTYQRIKLDVELGDKGDDLLDMSIQPSPYIQPRFHEPEEEIALGPACWLWDYLRRSRQAGFFVPLSGGIDSCATATIVFSMCREVCKAIEEGNEQVIQDMLRICDEKSDSTWRPKTPQELCGRLFCTCFMGTTNSSKETRQRAKDLAKAIGAYHTDTNIDILVSAITTLFTQTFGRALKYKVHGGSQTENLALQNIQARLRMVLSYLLAQTLPLIRGRTSPGALLVLGSANVDESLRGYLTKYDCSSADINPIGAISKTDLKRFIDWASKNFPDMQILQAFLDATPTAELEPITDSYVQSDEADMGVTYAELSTFGRLRKSERLGPYGMFSKLLHLWSGEPGSSESARGLSPRQIYEKVRHFYYYYGVNRHKMTTLTPSYHAEAYSPDDNRFDLRPFLYPSLDWAYGKIERVVEAWERKGVSANGDGNAEGGKKMD